MTPTENSGKPAWFELADKDALSADVRKVNRKLSAVAVLISGAVIATGAFFAAGSENDASAAQVSNTASTTTAPSTTVPAPTTSNPSQAATDAPSIMDPSVGGIPAPHSRGDDGDFEERDGFEHHGGFDNRHENDDD